VERAIEYVLLHQVMSYSVSTTTSENGAVARPSGRASLPLTSIAWIALGRDALPDGRATAPNKSSGANFL
jgi:hypothetical protein